MQLTSRLVHRLSKRGTTVVNASASFYSHKLNQAERKYLVHERRFLAVMLSLRVWRHLLHGSDSQVLCTSDHRSLQHFLTQANLSPCQVRWQQFLLA